MQWNELWQARIGYAIKREEAKIWESEISHEIQSPSAQELIDGVRTVANLKHMEKIKFRPGLEDLISAIRDTRKSDLNSGARQESRYNELCLEIAGAMPDLNKAWNIICNCDDIAMMQRAEGYARRELGFARPSVGADGKNGVSGLTSGIGEEVSSEIETRN